jgi:two-component system, cell cycle response regulator
MAKSDDDGSSAFAKALEGALAQPEPARIVGPPLDPLALVVTAGESLRGVLALKGTDTLTVGREPTSDFVPDDDGVSRRHLVISPTAAGWLVVAAGASPSFLNGVHFLRTIVKVGDSIRIGVRTTFTVVRLEDAEDVHARDALTGVFAKKAIVLRLKAAYETSLASNEAFTLALVNVDRFMKFNDRHGHVAGDTALRVLGAGILDVGMLPSPCAVGRYTGDGFAILMPRFKWVDARRIADDLRAMVAAFPIPYEGEKLWITVSVGLAALPNPAIKTPKELVRAADEQLFNAKRGGGNRTKPDA